MSGFRGAWSRSTSFSIESGESEYVLLFHKRCKFYYDGCLPVKLGSRGALRARPLVAAKRVSANGWALALLSLRPMHLRLLLPLAIVLCLAAAPALAQRRPVAARSSTPETGELA